MPLVNQIITSLIQKNVCSVNGNFWHGTDRSTFSVTTGHSAGNHMRVIRQSRANLPHILSDAWSIFPHAACHPSAHCVVSDHITFTTVQGLVLHITALFPLPFIIQMFHSCATHPVAVCLLIAGKVRDGPSRAHRVFMRNSKCALSNSVTSARFCRKIWNALG